MREREREGGEGRDEGERRRRGGEMREGEGGEEER